MHIEFSSVPIALFSVFDFERFFFFFNSNIIFLCIFCLSVNLLTAGIHNKCKTILSFFFSKSLCNDKNICVTVARLHWIKRELNADGSENWIYFYQQKLCLSVRLLCKQNYSNCAVTRIHSTTHETGN